MIEIKFRAWDDENKELVDGDEIEEITVPHIEEGEHVCDMTRYFTGLSYGKLFVGYYNKRGDWEECQLMQFTGLHDCHGKEIYEGDVIKVKVSQHFWIYKIGCVDAGGGNLFAINVRDNVTIDDETDTYTYQITSLRAGLYRPIPDGCEIIGNIYENPELMEAP